MTNFAKALPIIGAIVRFASRIAERRRIRKIAKQYDRLAAVLAGSELNAAAIAKRLAMSVPAAQKLLLSAEMAGVVMSRRCLGTMTRVYRVRPVDA
jgi:hypothetical protein